jgi:hypothetical protein
MKTRRAPPTIRIILNHIVPEINEGKFVEILFQLVRCILDTYNLEPF